MTVTILNAFIANDRILVATDTVAGNLQSGERYHNVSKVVPLPAIHAVVAARGDTYFFATLVAGLLMSVSCTLEDVAEGMSANLPGQLAGSMAGAQRINPGVTTTERFQVLLAGWSPQKQRMRAWEFQGDLKECSSREITGAYISPANPPPWDGIDPDTDTAMAHLARAQHAWTLQHMPDMACGGRLVLVELTRERITIERGATL